MNKIEALKTFVSIVGIVYIFYTFFQRFFVDNFWEHFVLLAFNPYYAFANYVLQNQTLIVGLLTLLVAVLVILIYSLMRKLEKGE